MSAKLLTGWDTRKAALMHMAAEGNADAIHDLYLEYGITIVEPKPLCPHEAGECQEKPQEE